MKVRIKFSKEGPVKFLGHLDTMRYFQKAVRRADLPAAFSSGYSPHMIMSFAAPLGVGTESLGEYFDLELSEEMSTREVVSRLEHTMVEGIHVLDCVKVEEGKAGKAMSLVAAADYEMIFREGKEPSCDWRSLVDKFLMQEEILVRKTTKKGEKEVNIRPFIYQMYPTEKGIFYQLASKSSNYTKPEAVTDAFFEWLQEDEQPFAYQIRRLEVYADQGTEEVHDFVPLLSLGEHIG